jgi:hypothetical protein
MIGKVVVGLMFGAALVPLVGPGATAAGAAGFTSAPGSPFASGGSDPLDVAVGDFNGDNKPDVAVADAGSNNVSLLLNGGSGGLSPAPGSPFASGGSIPLGLAVGDLNGDSKPDVVVVNALSANVSVLLGGSSVGLTPAPGSPFPSGGSTPEGVAVGDLNADNKQDVAVANFGSANVSVFLGDGGGLSPAPGSPFASGGIGPIPVAVGDFNGDNKPDVAVANRLSDNVSVLLGSGNGALSPAPGSPFPSGGSTPEGIAVGDLNADNKQDVAVANDASGNVSVLVGDGNGGLRPAPGSPFATGGIAPFGVGVRDFNGDNKPDVAVANFWSDNVSVLLGDGSGGLRPTTGSPFASGGSEPAGVAIGDFNGDNKPDIAVTNFGGDNVSVLLNGLAGPPSTLALSPKTDTNPVDAQHCVTGTVEDSSSSPTPGITIRFSVRGARTTTGSQTTDATGQATFCYQGPALPGADVISAYADTNGDSAQGPGEPADTAEKTWTLPTSTPPCPIKVSNGGWIVRDGADRANFAGVANGSSSGAVSGHELYQAHGPAHPQIVKSLDVLAITCNTSFTQARIFGQATIDGSGVHNFRIDVQDLGEPGMGRDTYRMRLDNGYDSGEHALRGGNIQIH